jgi:hypothetical protein
LFENIETRSNGVRYIAHPAFGDPDSRYIPNSPEKSWSARISFTYSDRIKWAKSVRNEYCGGAVRANDYHRTESQKYQTRAEEIRQAAKNNIDKIKDTPYPGNSEESEPVRVERQALLVAEFNELYDKLVPEGDRLWKNLVDAVDADTSRR